MSPYAGERWVLLLIALAALAVVNVPSTTDASRIALTEAVVRDGSLRIDKYAPRTTDRALYGGHVYSDKAPGMSFLAIPAYLALRAADAVRGVPAGRQPWYRLGHVWFLRLATGGLAFLAAAFLLGRAAEARAPGTGAATAVTFGLGTIAGPLGPTMFGATAAGTLALAAFLLARARRGFVLAGLAAGLAVLFEYQAVLLAGVVLAYVVACRREGALRVLAGAVPPAVALGAYNAAAFGSPLRFSYRYVAPAFIEQQRSGFFGIGRPSLHTLSTVLFDGRGLLVVSPVLALAAAGLVLRYRSGERAEALAALAAVALFLAYNSGYYLAYGGTSPGPRFFVPALPFLCLGLPDAFRRWPLATGLLALASLAVTTLDALAWAISNTLSIETPPQTVWSLAGAPRWAGVGLVCAATAAAAAVAAALSRARTRPA